MATGQPDFLGRGLLRPFRRDKKNDLASAAGISVVGACVGQVLGTKANSVRSPGEVPWRTDFGSRFHLLRHRNNTETLEQVAKVYAVEALQKWEPRAQVTSVAIERTTDPRKLIIRVLFNVVDSLGGIVARDVEAAVNVTTT